MTAGAFVHTIHVPESQFKWTCLSKAKNGTIEELAQVFVVKGRKFRYRCNQCGVCVTSYHTERKTWSVWGSVLERDSQGMIVNFEYVKPSAHQFYDTRVVDVADSLSEWDGYENRSNQLG